MKKNIFFIVLLLFLHALFQMGKLHAIEVEDPLSIGIELFEAGRFNQSYEKLSEAFDRYPENLELNFYLGRAAFETGNYEMAVMAFERILIASPFEPRVKLEIARAFQRLGANNTAIQYCREVLATNPPEAVKNNIQNFIRHIEKTEQKHFLNGQVAMGLDWNNNIWVSPSSGTIKTIIGDIYLTGPSSEKTKDVIYSTTVGIDHTYRFLDTDYSWKTAALFYRSGYKDTSALDIHYFCGITGPDFVFGKNKLGLRFLLNQVELGNTEYQNSIGFKAMMDHALNPHVFIHTAVRLETKDFPDNPERDSKNVSLQFGIDFLYRNSWYTLGLETERENAFDDENSYKRFISNILVSRELLFKITGSARYEYRFSTYDAPESLFARSRHDNQHSVGLGLKKILWYISGKPDHTVSLNFNYQHIWAFSNIDLYEFNQDLFQFSLIYNF